MPEVEKIKYFIKALNLTEIEKKDYEETKKYLEENANHEYGRKITNKNTEGNLVSSYEEECYTIKGTKILVSVCKKEYYKKMPHIPNNSNRLENPFTRG